MRRRLSILVLVISLSALWRPALGAPSDLERSRREREAIQRELESVARRVTAAESHLGDVQNEINRTTIQLREREEVLASAQSALERRASLIYRRGPVEFLSALLDATALQDFYRRVKVLERASEGDGATLVKANRARNAIIELRAELVARRDRERSINAELRNLSSELGARLRRAEELERRLQADQNERALRAALAERRSVTAESTASRSLRISSGRFVCPVQGPHVVTDSFGDPRSGGRSHQGIDIMARHGTPTAAVVEGTILRMNNSTLGGISLYLRGGDGTQYFYTHLNGYANASPGSHVAAGTIIAYVGSTGNASESSPHLHFEIHPGGRAAVDPYPTVKAACG